MTQYSVFFSVLPHSSDVPKAEKRELMIPVLTQLSQVSKGVLDFETDPDFQLSKCAGKIPLIDALAKLLATTFEVYLQRGASRYHDSCSRVRGYGLPACDRGRHGAPNDSE